jgi:hypothetical protein
MKLFSVFLPFFPIERYDVRPVSSISFSGLSVMASNSTLKNPSPDEQALYSFQQFFIIKLIRKWFAK